MGRQQEINFSSEGYSVTLSQQQWEALSKYYSTGQCRTWCWQKGRM